jgi:hypothetical protein
MFGVPKGTFYYTKDCQHVKNEVFYVFRGGESVLGEGYAWYGTWRLEKNIQFATSLYLLGKGEPMLNMKAWKACCNSFKW